MEQNCSLPKARRWKTHSRRRSSCDANARFVSGQAFTACRKARATHQLCSSKNGKLTPEEARKKQGLPLLLGGAAVYRCDESPCVESGFSRWSRSLDSLFHWDAVMGSKHTPVVSYPHPDVSQAVVIFVRLVIRHAALMICTRDHGNVAAAAYPHP